MDADSLQESWVELHWNFHGSSGLPSLQASGDNASLEKLLKDAQESCQTSRTNSKSSSPPGSTATRSPPVLISGQEIPQSDLRRSTDWIWDWSSRPERGSPRVPIATPTNGNGSGVATTGHTPRHGMSLRRSGLMKCGLYTDGSDPTGSLTALLISHAASFILGAAAMLIFLKKCCRWSSATSQHVPLD